MHSIDWKKYIATFVITATIFFTAIFASNYFNEKRIEEIRSMEERISIDILSLETQFDLLEELSCNEIQENSVLTQELNSLARRLNYAEARLGFDNDEVENLKRHYSLLQIKDYLLMKKVANKCDLNPVFLLYFYSNQGDCEDCIRAGHVLTFLREQYPSLRVYSFDYNLDLSVLRTLTSLNKVQNTLPAVVVGGEVYYGIKNLEDIEDILPILETLRAKEATSTTTSTIPSTNKD